MIIDAGAQILGLPNLEVVSYWLQEDTNAKAGIYFDENNVKMVLGKNGNVEALATSSFSTNLSQCLVYIDQWHARGVDYELPSSTRAAVTLCTGMTLEVFIQACFRLRKLGSGQSFTTFASPEVYRAIQKVAGTGKTDLDIVDIILFTIGQTCSRVSAYRSLHALRGLAYQARDAARDKYLLEQGQEGAEARYVDLLRSPESHVVESLYSVPSAQQSERLPFSLDDARADPKRLELVIKLKEGVRPADALSDADAMVEIEHHKETALQQEVEQERQRPARFIPCLPVMTEALERLAQTGTFDEDDSFMHSPSSKNHLLENSMKLPGDTAYSSHRTTAPPSRALIGLALTFRCVR